MAGFFKKLADRFQPNIMERLKQSAAAKKKLRDAPAKELLHTANGPVEPRVLSIDTESTPTGRIYQQIRVETSLPTTASTGDWNIHVKHNKEVIWRMWHVDNNATACTTYADPWQQWHNCGTTTSNIITVTNSWVNWAEEAHDRYTTRKMTKAERLRREEEERRWRAEEAARHEKYLAEEREREAKRKAADERAMGLLISMLTREQQTDLKNHKHFFVKALSGRLYRIDQGSHGNVKVVDPLSRKVIERLCIQPDGVPAGDSMLMQKLLIETAEPALRKYANITLENGQVLRGDPGMLTGEKLAQIVPLRKAA